MRAPILLLLVAPLGFGLARADEPSTTPGGPAPSASTSVSASASAIPLRKPRPEPTEVEVIDLSPDFDPQALALGAHVGAGLLAARYAGPPQAATHFALVADFGLGPGGKRTPWTLEPWIAFAISFNALANQSSYPNRFTEFGVRIVHRWGEDSALSHQWLSLGVGAVWTNTRPSSGFFDPGRGCSGSEEAIAAKGLDCSRVGPIAPGALLDVGVGVYETVIRRARWGFGVRAPVQISKIPGLAVFGFFYAQIGTAM